MSLKLDPLEFEVLTPAETQAIWLEVEQEAADFLNAGLMGLLEYGFMAFEIAKPGQALDTFIQCTYPDDIPLVENPDYLELRTAGAVDDLRCNVEWQALLQPNPQTGQVQQPSDYRPFMWAIALLMPPMFKWLQRRFITLRNAEMKKQGVLA